MRFQIVRTVLSGLALVIAASPQTAPVHEATVPIYHVTVVERSVSAINYQYRGGPTEIDFRGTVLLPQSKGDAIVESKTGRTDIDARFQHLETPARFGPEFLTYVLWAITPEGHVKNLGEVLADGSDKAHLHVTTDLQAFGLIVAAEPYSSVRTPSDVVVLENQVRPDTIGSTEPIHARFELLPRGTYTYNVPADLRAVNSGPKVSMDRYEQIVEIYQAQNAVQIAQAQGANQYAPDVIAKAAEELGNARQLEASHAGRSNVVTMARAAAQTAEDARDLTVRRKQNAEIAQDRDQAARDKQLREEAEHRAQRAEAQAADDHDALEAERAKRIEAETALSEQTSGQASAQTTAAPPAAAPELDIEPAPDRADEARERNEQRMATRRALLTRLAATLGSVEVIDAPRGLVIMVPDADFRGGVLNPSVAAMLPRIGPVIAGTPGLSVEVDGYTDLAEAQHEAVANERAQDVLGTLVRGGLASRVFSRGMANSHPLGSNATAAGREQNRRVEIVIAGDAIGTLPLWDKTYTLSSQR
jgi:flagellar motor protein MotB